MMENEEYRSPYSTAPPKRARNENVIPVSRDAVDADSPFKRQRTNSPSPRLSSEVQPSRKGRACLACRKLKVKCDSAERGAAGCSRCQRLRLECVTLSRPRMSIDADVERPSRQTVDAVDRAVDDILRKLGMPSLEAYSHGYNMATHQASKGNSVSHTHRDSSRESDQAIQDNVTAPMDILYEATQLSSLRSRLKQSNLAKRDPRHNLEMDLIAQKLISVEDAEELLQLYKTSLSRYPFAATVAEDVTLQSLRESSSLLFTAIMLVSALHVPGKENFHSQCHRHLLELISLSMLQRFHTLEDIRGLCTAALWQPDLSWKLSGLCVRMGTELNLHQAFYTAFYARDISDTRRAEVLEKARVWYLLYVMDHYYSLAYGRPPVTAELLPIKEYDVFVNAPWCTLSDRRLISQVSLFVILSKAYEVFGLEPERLMGGDDTSLLMHLRFTEDLKSWRDRWKDIIMPDKFVADYPLKGVHLQYHFSSLVLNSLALRGRHMDDKLSTTLPHSLRPLALRAIDSAHAILQFFLDEPSYRNALVGIPLYLHSMIAFAAVFLLKTSRRWHLLGVSIDPETKTRPLVQGIIDVLKRCEAGANHMVYSMAAGFERLLKTTWHEGGGAASLTVNGHVHVNGFASVNRSSSHSVALWNEKSGNGGRRGTSPGRFTQQLNHAASTGTADDYDNNNDIMISLDDVLWSSGLGFDLLHTNRDYGSGTGLDSSVAAIITTAGGKNYEGAS